MTWKRRYTVLTVLFSAYLLCYMDRMVMASSVPFIAREFGLTPLAMGGVLSAFFIGYSIMQIPGGLLVDRMGPRRVMTASIVGWSIFTALTGMATSLASMIGIRVLFGLAEGPFPPTASKTIAVWFPRQEVGRANGLQLAAVNIGAAFAPIVVAPLIAHWGWRVVFYVLLVPGFAMAVVVWKLISDGPAPVPAGDRVPAQTEENAMGVGQVLRRPAVFWCALTLFLGNIAGWGLMNWLPTYLLQVRGFSVTKMGIFASLPFVAGAIGYYVGGFISDRFFERRRQIPIAIGLALGAVLTFAAAIAPTGEWAIAALAIAFLFLFISSAGTFTLPLVIAPERAVGSVFGVVNTAGQIAAFLSPLLVGYLLTRTNGNFTLVFYCLVGVFSAAAAAASLIRQPASK